MKERKYCAACGHMRCECPDIENFGPKASEVTEDAFQDALKEYAAVSEVTDDVNEIAKHFFLAGREHQREVDAGIAHEHFLSRDDCSCLEELAVKILKGGEGV